MSEKSTTPNTSILAPGRPSDKDNGLHAPAQLRLARTHGTQRKRRRYEIDLPVTGDRTSRTNSPKPPIYIYIDPREEPYSVAPLFVFHCLLSLVKSDIDHYYFDIALGVSREFTIK